MDKKIFLFKGDKVKKSRYTKDQILQILEMAESEKTIKEVCKEVGIAEATFYNWKSKYKEIAPTNLKRIQEFNDLKIQELEKENAYLKKMFAEVSLENRVLQDKIEKIKCQ